MKQGQRQPHGAALRYIREVVLTYEGDDWLPWPYNKNGQGYGYVWHEGHGKGAHRLVCEMAKGPPPSPYHDAAHSCGKGHEGCVNKHHLSWKTKTENQADRIGHGTSVRGTAVAGNKLCEAEVLEIRKAKGAVTQKQIAARFGVSKSLVKQIHSGRVWSWLE